jgi:hypothetical protein
MSFQVCPFCGSANQRVFPAEVNIHFPGKDGLTTPTVWVFPQLSVCLDCGATEFVISGPQLEQLGEGGSSGQSNKIAA